MMHSEDGVQECIPLLLTALDVGFSNLCAGMGEGEGTGGVGGLGGGGGEGTGGLCLVEAV